MAHEIKISNGTIDVSLLLDADGYSMLANGNVFGVAGKTNTYHTGIGAEGQAITSSSDSNGVWPLKFKVGGADMPAILANLSRLEVLAEMARSYNMFANVDEVYLYIKLDGCTYATIFTIVDIKYSSVALFNFYNMQNDVLTFGDGISIELETFPYGRAESSELLQNYQKNPHFEASITGGGSILADSWTLSGTPTPTLSTTIRVCGSRSQKLVTAASGTEGISAAQATSPTGVSPVVSYAWVYRSTGSDDITLTLTGATSGASTSTYDDATTTRTDTEGNTWKRIEITLSAHTSSETFDVGIERLTGDASEATTFYVDQTYLGFPEAEVIPQAWSSYYRVYQHSLVVTGAVSYIDVVDVGGDVPALMKMEFDTYNVADGTMHAGRCSANGSEIAACTVFADYIGFADVNAIGGASERIDVGDTTVTTVGGSRFTDVSSETRRFRVFAAVRDDYGDSSTDAYRVNVRAKYGDSSQGWTYTENVKFPETNSTHYVWLDLGTIDFSSLKFSGESGIDMFKWLYIEFIRETDPSGGAEYAYLDSILLYPYDDNSMFIAPLYFGSSTYVLSGLTERNDLFYSKYLTTSITNSPYLGRIPQVMPRRFNRFGFLPASYGAGGTVMGTDVTAYANVVIEYKRRTKFLLGNATAYADGPWVT